jgi:hypothetical protein
MAYSIKEFIDSKKQQSQALDNLVEKPTPWDFQNLSNASAVKEIANAKVISFIQKYICGVGFPYDKYVEHEKLAEFVFKYFTGEELLTLLETCHNDICENACVIIGGNIIYPSDSEQKDLVSDLASKIRSDVRPIMSKSDLDENTFVRMIADLKAFIFILDLIRIKEENNPVYSFVRLEEYIEGLKIKFQEQHDIYRFKKEARKMIDELKLEVIPKFNNSVAFLEVDEKKINKNPIVVKMTMYLKQELGIPVVVIPTSMQVSIVEEVEKADNSINELEV